MTAFSRHSPLRGQFAELRQLQGGMIKKQLPSMLSKRLSEFFCNREEFEKAATPYNIATKTSGYHKGLAYDDLATDTRARRRRITSAI